MASILNTMIGFREVLLILVVQIPGQRVKSGRSSKWFARRWVTIKTDEDAISPTDLVPVWSSGQWALKWKEAPE